MALNKKQKTKTIEDLRKMFSQQKAVILIGITGLKVKDFFQLRNKIKLIDGKLRVAKKTLMKIVFKENKLEFEEDKFKEEVALVFGFQDEILLAKTVEQFAQNNQKLKILGGYFNNNFIEGKEVITLAQLPTKNELMARLVGSLNTPISNFVSVLGGNIKGLITVLTRVKT